MNRKSITFMILVSLLFISALVAGVRAGDVIDDFLPEATNDLWCAGYAGAVWADLDEDGTFDTQVVFTTLTGEAYVMLDPYKAGKRYFFTFHDSECGGSSTDRGRYKIHFVDILEPGFVWNDPNTWVYKRIPSVSLKVIHDACWDWDSPRYDDPNVHPYQHVQAYQNLGQTDSIQGCESSDGFWALYQFSDPIGIKELYITTDFCENTMDDLILYATDQNFVCAAEELPSGVVLLFDTSGSMSWSHEGEPWVDLSLQRLTLAKLAAIPFLEMLNDYYSGQIHFGIATFPYHPWGNFQACNGQVIYPRSLSDDANINSAVAWAIPGLIAEGNTPLLAGVGTAIMMSGPELNKVIVLLSDGYHNCPSTVDPGDPQVTELINQLVAMSIKVYTIGFGRPTDVDHPLLQALANQTGGTFYDVTVPGFNASSWDPATALQSTYKAILVDGLGLQPIVDPFGVITAGEIVTREVKLNEHDRKVSFFLSWVTPQSGRLGLKILSSDGQTVPMSGPGIRLHQGETHLTVTLDEAFLQTPGKIGPTPWKVEIDGRSLFGDDSGYEQEKYQYSVISDSRLKMKPTIQAPSHETGAIITLSVEITEAGEPVTGLKDVSVKVVRPDEGLGNWFAMHKISFEELETIPEKIGQEVLSNRYRKATYLVDERKVDFPRRIDAGTLQLYDDGTRGDVKAGDGIYTNTFTDTAKEGTYSFHFYATGPTKGGNSFEREVEIQKYLRAVFSPEHSTVEVVSITGDKNVQRVRVFITTKDALGNYLGPGYSGAITVNTAWGQAVSGLQDNLDGTYSQIFELPTSVSQEVEFTINVAEITKSVTWEGISIVGPKISDLFNWLTYILIVVIAVFTGLLVRARRS